MVKTRKKQPTAKQINDVTEQLADKPYGEQKDKVTRTSISIPQSLLNRVEDFALENKRKATNPKNVSALIKEALLDYLNKHNK